MGASNCFLAGDLTTPLLSGLVESEAETFFKPSPGVDEPKSENWFPIYKVSKPPGETEV